MLNSSKKYLDKCHKRGFVALMSSIIISAILLMVVVLQSFTGFNSRYNILYGEYKERGNAIAEACVSATLLLLANNSAYVGNATTSISGSECYVGPIVLIGSNKVFMTRAIYKDTHTNLKISVNSSDLSIVSWDEFPDFE